MQGKIITYLDKDIALDRLKTAKSYIDILNISDIQLIYKTKNGKYVTGGVYEDDGELKFKGPTDLIDSIDKVIIMH